jgi:hypothetical protein
MCNNRPFPIFDYTEEYDYEAEKEETELITEG